jgi:hypothetical protein
LNPVFEFATYIGPLKVPLNPCELKAYQIVAFDVLVTFRALTPVALPTVEPTIWTLPLSATNTPP